MDGADFGKVFMEFLPASGLGRVDFGQHLLSLLKVGTWGGEYMPNLHLQIHPVFIPITSRAKI
jgi:hypothetical protein